MGKRVVGYLIGGFTLFMVYNAMMIIAQIA